jgi:hypothetical protein
MSSLQVCVLHPAIVTLRALVALVVFQQPSFSKNARRSYRFCMLLRSPR